MCTLSDISTQATASTTACVGAFSEMIRNPFAKEENEEEAAEEPAAEEKKEEETAEEPAAEEEKPAEDEEEDKAEEAEEKPEV